MAETPKAAPAPVLPSSPAAALAAYGRVEPKLLELGPDDLVTVYVEVPQGRELRALRPPPPARAQRRDRPGSPEPPDRDAGRARGLRPRGLVRRSALQHARERARREEAQRRGRPLREGLLVAAEALGHRNLLDKQRVADIREGEGHADLASDLIALAELFRGSWDKVRAKTAVEDEELERAT